MANSVANLTDIQSWVPAYDPRRLPKTTVIGGRNFVHDVDGIRSAFGSVYADYNLFDNVARRKVQTLRVNDEFFYGTPAGLFRLNPDNAQLEPILILPIDVANWYWPWTMAFVGNVYYFAQYGIGLYQYNAVTRALAKISTPANDDVFGICASYSRLILLSSTLVAWSSLDDGTDFIPSLTTGAGFQALSLVGQGPFRVDPLDDGFVVCMKDGILKATNVAASYVFRFDAYTKDVKLFSPNAAVLVPDLGLICLDRAGLRLIAAGAAPAIWEQDMGTFLKDNPIKDMDKRKIGCVSMFYSQAARMLFISFAPNVREGALNSTYVYYVPSGKWGPMSYQHYGILETAQGLDMQDTCGYVGIDGYVHAFSDIAYSETLFSGGICFLDCQWRQDEEVIALDNVDTDGNVITLGFTELRSFDMDPTPFLALEGNALHTQDINGKPIPLYTDRNQLFSTAEIGMFRFSQLIYVDETSMCYAVTVGLKEGDANLTFTDLNVEDDNVDLNTRDGIDDQGDITDYQRFQLTLIDTDDGFTLQVQGEEPLTPFSVDGSSMTYSTQGFSSVYHKLRLDTVNVGDSFFIKTIEVGGVGTGRRYVG